MPSSRFPIPQGTLDMLILQILSLEPAHGYGIAQRLQQVSREAVQVNQGSLYPAGLAEGRVASIRNRPRSQVLFTHARRREAACGRETELEPPDHCRPADF